MRNALITDCLASGSGPLPFAECESINPKSEIRNLKSRGFTLVEIIITIVIVGIIAGIAAMIILQGVRAYSAEQSRGDVHYQARLAVERMVREVRLVRSRTVADIPTMTPTDLLFCDVTGKAVEFQLVGTALNRRESATCSPLAWGGWNALATGVTPLNFTYFQPDGVTAATATTLWFIVIDMTDAQGSETLQLRTRVHPRNF
jgi:prepilin-type N-terminal cleavage/methylation domain-containing protein